MSTPSLAEVRSELRAWLSDSWDADLPLAEWRDRLVDSGWGVPTWPQKWFGRDLPEAYAQLAREELERAGAVGLAHGIGMLLAAPTMLAHASDELLGRLLRPTMTGEVLWCQLFSEPGSGSDLAGLATRAVRDGDRWVVNGQKVWTTGAHVADYGLLLARTDVDAEKHNGITYFVLDMHQPGIEVRPLRQMNGHQSFNEVFISDALVAAGDVIGDVDGGWRVALTTLAHERRRADFHPRIPAGARGRAVEEAAAEAAAASEPHKWYPQREGRVDLAIQRARATDRGREPIVRDELARLVCMDRAARWMSDRAQALLAAGGNPGPAGSLSKLARSAIARQARVVQHMLSDAQGMLAGADDPTGGVTGEIVLSVPAISIAGGTDEIQKNIVAERVLGLPKEPKPGGRST